MCFSVRHSCPICQVSDISFRRARRTCWCRALQLRERHRVEVLLLSPCIIHTLWPFELIGFSDIKSKYKNLTRDLSTPIDAAFAKENKLILFDHKAGQEGFLEMVFWTGWQAASLVLFTPDLIIDSSQILDQTCTPTQPWKPVNVIHTLRCTS